MDTKIFLIKQLDPVVASVLERHDPTGLPFQGILKFAKPLIKKLYKIKSQKKLRALSKGGLSLNLG